MSSTTPSRDFSRVFVPNGSLDRRYEIVSEIASGGMATVYLAVQHVGSEPERLVALKKSREPKRPRSPFDAIAQEAQLAACVEHPNVVATLGIEPAAAGKVIIMQYVEGASLRELAKSGPVPPRIVARIVLDACKGLGAIHAACDDHGNVLGLVHRDVSPENLLVGVDGTSRLADFGIAICTGSARTTQRDARRGKSGYMAPEYLRDGDSTPATDLYALAVVAWEALTGEPLFADTETVEATVAMRRQLVLPPSAFAERVSPGWDSLLLRALGCSDAARFEDADAFECALLKACGGDVASRRELASFVERIAATSLSARRDVLRARELGVSHVPVAVKSEVHVISTRPDLPATKREGANAGNTAHRHAG